MNWWSGFVGPKQRDAPIGGLTWFRLGGRARYLCQPRDVHELASLVADVRRAGVPLKVLGAGANVLVTDDGFDGVVVRLDQPAFARVALRGTEVEVDAGVDLMQLARSLSAMGLSGLECLAGIPATVGGAVRMNAGGRCGEFGDVVREIRVVGADGAIETWSADRIGFGYRHSELGDRIVLSAMLELTEDDPIRVRRTFEDTLAAKRRTQPLADHSAGCIFKNPKVASAGALIDQAGLKGTCCGKARVSQEHANFIVADKGATASDVLHLIDLIRERVLDAHGMELEVEIDIW